MVKQALHTLNRSPAAVAPEPSTFVVPPQSPEGDDAPPPAFRRPRCPYSNTKDLSSLRTAVFGLSGLQSQLAELRGQTQAKGSKSSWPGVLSVLPPRVFTWALGIAGFLGLALIVALAFAGELGSTLAAVGSH